MKSSSPYATSGYRCTTASAPPPVHDQSQQLGVSYARRRRPRQASVFHPYCSGCVLVPTCLRLTRAAAAGHGNANWLDDRETPQATHGTHGVCVRNAYFIVKSIIHSIPFQVNNSDYGCRYLMAECPLTCSLRASLEAKQEGIRHPEHCPVLPQLQSYCKSE